MYASHRGATYYCTWSPKCLATIIDCIYSLSTATLQKICSNQFIYAGTIIHAVYVSTRYSQHVLVPPALWFNYDWDPAWIALIRTKFLGFLCLLHSPFTAACNIHAILFNDPAGGVFNIESSMELYIYISTFGCLLGWNVCPHEFLLGSRWLNFSPVRTNYSTGALRARVVQFIRQFHQGYLTLSEPTIGSATPSLCIYNARKCTRGLRRGRSSYIVHES